MGASRLGKLDRTLTNMLHWLHYTVGQMMLEQRMYEEAIEEFTTSLQFMKTNYLVLLRRYDFVSHFISFVANFAHAVHELQIARSHLHWKHNGSHL